ncbi:MAG: hypothetical protein ACXADW_20045 [Candidatus Hodarchaeales archaeon]|jgi:hypothetical protein
MDIDKIAEAKRAMELEIVNMISSFESMSSLSVMEILIDRMATESMGDEKRTSIVTGVAIRVELEPIIIEEGNLG